MQTSKIEAVRLTADHGHVFTQRADVPILSRILAPELYVSASDIDNWREITDAEAEPLRAEQAAAREQQRLDEEAARAAEREEALRHE